MCVFDVQGTCICVSNFHGMYCVSFNCYGWSVFYASPLQGYLFYVSSIYMTCFSMICVSNWKCPRYLISMVCMSTVFQFLMVICHLSSVTTGISLHILGICVSIVHVMCVSNVHGMCVFQFLWLIFFYDKSTTGISLSCPWYMCLYCPCYVRL